MRFGASMKEMNNGNSSIVRDALFAICDGKWEDAEKALARDPQLVRHDAACLNLRGIVLQARGQWSQARRFYGKAARINGGYLPAEQNLRRFYELNTFGRSKLPVAVTDRATLRAVRAQLVDSTTSPQRLRQLDALHALSPN